MPNHTIFLDTSIFESENYFEGRNINLLLHLSQQNLIDLKITDIVYREIINRITDHVIKAANLFKTQKLSFESNARILRNINIFEEHFKKVDFKKIKNSAVIEIIQRFEDIIKNNSIEIIDTSTANLKEVTDDYFAIKPPFKEGSKKTEFPDAISINAIKFWCIQNSKDCYFISNDRDFEFYDNKNINCKYNLSSLLEFLYKENSDIQFEVIHKIYDNAKSQIEESINSLLSNDLEAAAYNYLHEDYWMEDLELNFIEIDNLEIVMSLINEIEETNFTFQLGVNVSYSVDSEFTNLNHAVYDKEDRIWYGEERVTDVKRFNSNVLVYPHFEYYPNKTNGKFIEITDYEILDTEQI
jgi:hypothetical protein